MNQFTADYILTMKDIVREGHPVLQQETEKVTLPLSIEDQDTLICMMNYLKNSQDPILSKKYNLRPGVGLSANQIGLNKRMFVAYLTDEKEQLHEYTLINPKIISHSVSMIYLPEGEGCLSVDRNVEGYVPRYERVKIKAYDVNGKEIVLKVKGYPSIVLQHEIDHLDGKMFYDHINKENPFQLPADVDIKSLY
ncbi:peptide deformylase [Fredinandcohnia quinoae]|uniref:Peptide deformylase n=1 Tax=Fredinandcohnia quinoae TaxID=2918902 RepID=A0AAW5E8B7_9BACI|nr:peptide deformylase [Fredinandcohnia sp. SECRCQ15]MCH1625616.1 peptide deformylase [Fredinandcohnia sp. SECRCQ15]